MGSQRLRECAACRGVARSACAACRSVYYCDARCQRADWLAGHKRACAASCAAAVALREAAGSGDLAALAAALDKGAAINFIPPQRMWSPRLLVGLRGNALLSACLHNFADGVRLLLSRGADPDLPQPDDGCALFACVGNHCQEAALAMLEGGASVACRSPKQWTVLHHCGMQGAAALALACLDAGADVNAVTDEGDTAVFVAATALSFAIPADTSVGRHAAAVRAGRTAVGKKFVDTIDVLRAKGGRCLFDFEEQDLMKMEGVGGGMGMGLGASENVGCPTQ